MAEGLAIEDGSGVNMAKRDARWGISRPAALILLGVAALYLPVLYEHGAQFWWNADDSHAGLLLLFVAGAYWLDRDAVRWDASRQAIFVGCGVVLFALLIYVLGRITALVQLQGLSMPLLATGLVLATGGRRLLRRWWLLNCLLIFSVPWLGPLGDAFLVPLRLYLTSSAVSLLSDFGMPVSSTGVLINVGFVQLNVAGACVGLRSMISLIAIGLLFLHFFPPRSLWTGLLFIALLPVIGLGANFCRILFLIVMAKNLGATGAGGLHDTAAYGELVISIGLFLLVGRALSARVPAA